MDQTLRRGAALTALFFLSAMALGANRIADDAKDLKDKALALNSVTTDDATKAKLRELFRDKPGTKKLVNVALEEHKAGLSDKKRSPYKINATLLLAQAAHGVKEYAAAESFYEFSAEQAERLSSEKRLAQSYQGLIGLHWDMKEYNKAETWSDKLLEFRGGNEIARAQFYARNMKIRSLTKLGEVDKALDQADALTQLDGIGWLFMELKVWVQREAGKIDDAIKTQKDLVERIEEMDRIPENEKAELKRSAQYGLSGLYTDVNKIDEAAKLLKQLIEDDPENPSAYNDLGFIWCDNDKNIEESERLIRKAIELDEKQRRKLLKEKKIDEEEAKKANAAYLDSLGWVLFKQKKYAEAKKYLLEAVKDEDDGNHIEIWDHLADVHMALGETKEAIDVWTKALKLDDVSRKDTERRKKVTEKLKKAREMKDAPKK